MTKEHIDIPAGKLVAFSEGAYSYYQISCFCVTLQPITTGTFQSIVGSIKKDITAGNVFKYKNYKKWRAEGGSFSNSSPPEEYVTDDCDAYEKERVISEHFLPRCFVKGLLLAIDWDEIHFKEYSSLEIGRGGDIIENSSNRLRD